VCVCVCVCISLIVFDACDHAITSHVMVMKVILSSVLHRASSGSPVRTS